MKKNKMHLLKVSAVVVSLGTIMSTFGFACSAGLQGMQTAEQSSVGLGGGPVGGGSTPAVETPVNPVILTVGVPILSQTFASLSAGLQVTPSTASRDEFNRQAANFSDSGQPNSLGAPLSLSQSTLAAQVCLDRVNFENNAANPKDLFMGINLNAAPNNNVNDANMTGVINRIARSLWQRNETAAERTLLMTAVRESMALDNQENANKSQEAMLFLCTVMASSIAGIQQ